MSSARSPILALVLAAACGSKDEGPVLNVPKPPLIAGGLAGVTSGGASEVGVARLQLDVIPATMPGPSTPGTAKGSLAIAGSPSTPLQGTIDDTGRLQVQGGGFVLDGRNTYGLFMEGTYTGPASSGVFSLAISPVRTFCGSVGGDETGAAAMIEGKRQALSFVVVTPGRRSTCGGSYTPGGAGQPAIVTIDGPERIHLDGTLQGDQASGTWQARDLSGTWSVGVDGCL